MPVGLAESLGEHAEVLSPGARVLVVDDDRFIRFAVQRALEREGFTVTAAADGWRALECFDDEPPDLMMLDLKMPGMDGLQLLQKLRSNGQTLPVLVMTDFPFSHAADQIAQYPPVYVLSKRDVSRWA
jgi:DNA-binding response OmpR family regulator